MGGGRNPGLPGNRKLEIYTIFSKGIVIKSIICGLFRALGGAGTVRRRRAEGRKHYEKERQGVPKALSILCIHFFDSYYYGDSVLFLCVPGGKGAGGCFELQPDPDG